ncbi:acylamino-acid-releasing enzyme [Myroides odoratimimus]|uniref:alpha/beta hydrolase family protein n=1 Tax=Myroides odoratimimus TaxID=76832 RepID=UPI000725E7F6|nr:YqiA/YcfP family alpha/beta fold hydrolase [Myroides odoratimimus]GAQ15696.1 dipeptidyl peptidase IV [Myroides odoratimimus]GAQ15745.1 dipeptidyl peptidase IV [Myroides odoratimimus]GAQ15986.1 dipeptidyl peptidase IV [Myroides odoratimimus]GAQ15991.1 acylamino-acid-releasing enzyme [Myroides odoratimimus]
MDTNILKKVIYLILLLSFSNSKAQVDSISISPLWFKLQNISISNSGKWLITQETNNEFVKRCISNADTKKEICFEDTGFIYFIDDIKIAYQKKNQLYIVNLQNHKQTVIDQVNSFEIIANNRIFILTDQKTALLLDTSNNIDKKWEQKSIKQYFISPSRQQMMYLQGDQFFSLDLKNLKNSSLTGSFQLDSLSNPIWDDKQNHLIVKTTRNEVIHIDLKKKVYFRIEPTKQNQNLINTSYEFVTDNNILIKYLYLHKTQSPIVDIWYTNDYNLEAKKNTLKGDSFVVNNLLYNIENKQTTPIIDNEIISFINNNEYLTYDSKAYKDYSKNSSTVSVYKHNILKNSNSKLLDSLSNYALTISNDKNKFAYKSNNKWHLYNLKNNKTTTISNLENQQNFYWTTNPNKVLITNSSNLWLFDTNSQRLNRLTNNETINSLEINILNHQSISSLDTNFKPSAIVDLNKSIIIQTLNVSNNRSSLHIIDENNIIKPIIESTSDKITQVLLSNQKEQISFLTENYNMSYRLNSYKDKQLSIVKTSSIADSLFNWRKQVIIKFKTVQGKQLKGILYYPKNFSELKKYPMITHLYETQNHLQNVFRIPKLENDTGYNNALLTEQGYFVFEPDTYVSEKGPGVTALECVEAAIQEVQKKVKQIDSENLGIMGQSFGGYLVNYIITQVDIFKVAISGSSRSELIVDSYGFNYYLNRMSYAKIEDAQYKLKRPYAEKQKEYFANSPIYYSQNIQTPILLWAGNLDENVPWRHTMNLYGALRRYNKQAIALFYTKDGHSLADKTNQKDLTIRSLNWLSYFLKDTKNIDWIKQGLN